MIDCDTALEIARKRATEKGWAFGESVEILERRGWLGGVKHFAIEINPEIRGTKARFKIDAATGEIISAGYIPR